MGNCCGGVDRCDYTYSYQLIAKVIYFVFFDKNYFYVGIMDKSVYQLSLVTNHSVFFFPQSTDKKSHTV